MTNKIGIDDIKHHLTNVLLNDDKLDLKPDDDLLLSGLLDSINVVKLVSYLEQACGLSIPPEHVIVENFGTLDHIMAYLKAQGSA